jgi:plastocyanin
MLKVYRSALLIAAVGMLASCGTSAATTPDSAPTPTVNGAAVVVPLGDAYGDTSFNPHSVTINAGGKVSFNSNDAIEHHPTADDGSWDGDLAPGGSFNQPFPTAGTYSYHCSIHPNMTGTVVVK